MRHFNWLVAGALLVPLGSVPVAAQMQSGPAAITSAQARAVVTELRRKVAENYVVPDKKAAIDAALGRGLASGRYDVSAPQELVQRVNADLAAASNDGHLNISFNPAQAARLKGHAGDEIRSGPAWERDAQMRNHGIITMRMIPGNIRYVAYDNFVWTGAKSAAAIDTMMAFLKEGDAVIIDLSANGGGSPLAVQYMISHFMEGGRPLVEFHMGGKPEPDRRSSLASVPNQMVGKPLYVLTGSHTASAAEEFVGHVAGFKLGEVVGEKTYGAAFRNDLYDGGHGFVLSVSVGRPVLAATGGDWEGKGIAPTIPAAAGRAQDAALAHALRRIAQNAPADDKKAYVLRAEVHQARVTPSAPAHPIATYAGTYGVRSVTVDGDRLVYERQGGLRTILLPLGD
ncbi:MAG TPA: S41 family peptidase, partial [Sphingomicrobium sp.]